MICSSLTCHGGPGHVAGGLCVCNLRRWARCTDAHEPEVSTDARVTQHPYIWCTVQYI